MILIFVFIVKIMPSDINTNEFKFIGSDVSLDLWSIVGGRISNPKRKAGTESLNVIVLPALLSVTACMGLLRTFPRVKFWSERNFVSLIIQFEFLFSQLS